MLASDTPMASLVTHYYSLQQEDGLSKYEWYRFYVGWKCSFPQCRLQYEPPIHYVRFEIYRDDSVENDKIPPKYESIRNTKINIISLGIKGMYLADHDTRSYL